MRDLINLIESAQKAEWFNHLYGLCRFNITLARRLIETGEVKAQKKTVSVKSLGGLLGLNDEEFGSRDFSDDIEGRGINIMSAIQSRSTMHLIPDEIYNEEPAIIAQINNADIMKRVGLKLDSNGEAENNKPYSVIIDGNHRLGRMFLEGVDQTTIYVVDHDEALKFCFDRYANPILRDASYRK